MMRLFKHWTSATKALAAAGLVFVISAATANAAGVTNGGFETGDFTGWNTYGNTSIQDNTFGTGPTEGNYDALLSSGRSSGTTGNNDSETSTQLATDLGLSSTYFSSQGFTEGSAISQTVTVSSTDTLSFDYNFLTNEANDGTGNPDEALFMILTSPSGSTPVSAISLGVPTDATQLAPAQTGFAYMSGFNTSGPTAFGVSGTYTLTFAVLDYGDTFSPSALLLDNVAVNAATGNGNGNGNGNGGGGGGAVPLPAAFYLFPLGLVAAAGYGMQMRRRALAL